MGPPTSPRSEDIPLGRAFFPLKNTGSSWARMGLLGWRWVMAAMGLPSRNPVSNACPPPSQVMLVGDSGVGKTCLLVRFKDGAFLAGSFISTVGIDFRVSAWGGSSVAAHGVWQVNGGFCRGETKHRPKDLNLVILTHVSASRGTSGC